MMHGVHYCELQSIMQTICTDAEVATYTCVCYNKGAFMSFLNSARSGNSNWGIVVFFMACEIAEVIIKKRGTISLRISGK